MSESAFDDIAGIHERSRAIPSREKCLLPGGKPCDFRLEDACCNGARATDQWSNTCPNYQALEALRTPPRTDTRLDR